MRVFHVIDKSFLGGGQTAVRHLLEGFRDSDVETLLACRDGGPLVGAARNLDTAVHTIPFDKRFRPGPARAVARVVADESVNVIHSHGLVAAFYCTLARRYFGADVPLIYHQHGFHHHNYGRLTVGLRKAIEKWVCRKADAVIPVSSADARRLAEGGYLPGDRIRLIHYGIPQPAPSVADQDEARSIVANEADLPCVGIVGRLHPQKGIDVFLKAVARVVKKLPARVVIIGSGELELEHRALATELGLDSSLCWAGGRPGAPFLPLMDVAVLSSRWEGLPFVLLEYMATARAIVTTDVDGCLDAVGSEEAEIVPKDDPEAMASAILRLLREPDLASHKACSAQARYEKRFSLSAMTTSFRSLYRELLR